MKYTKSDFMSCLHHNHPYPKKEALIEDLWLHKSKTLSVTWLKLKIIVCLSLHNEKIKPQTKTGKEPSDKTTTLPNEQKRKQTKGQMVQKLHFEERTNRNQPKPTTHNFISANTHSVYRDNQNFLLKNQF